MTDTYDGGVVSDGLLSFPLRAAWNRCRYAVGIYGARGQTERQCECHRLFCVSVGLTEDQMGLRE